MARMELTEYLKLKQKQNNKKKPKRKAIIAKEKDNRGRKPIYDSADDVKNVNGFFYFDDYVFFCNLAYTLRYSQIVLANKLFTDLFEYLRDTNNTIDTMFLRGIGKEGNKDSCVKKNIRLYKDIHEEYDTLRKTSKRTIADIFNCAVELFRHNNPGFEIIENPRINVNDFKIVPMKGNFRTK